MKATLVKFLELNNCSRFLLVLLTFWRVSLETGEWDEYDKYELWRINYSHLFSSLGPISLNNPSFLFFCFFFSSKNSYASYLGLYFILVVGAAEVMIIANFSIYWNSTIAVWNPHCCCYFPDQGCFHFRLQLSCILLRMQSRFYFFNFLLVFISSVFQKYVFFIWILKDDGSLL